jgi:hypothetical protein
MGAWHSTYHEALLVRLVSMAVIVVVLAPVLWMLFSSAFRLAMHFDQRIGQSSRLRHWHLS